VKNEKAQSIKRRRPYEEKRQQEGGIEGTSEVLFSLNASVFN